MEKNKLLNPNKKTISIIKTKKLLPFKMFIFFTKLSAKANINAVKNMQAAILTRLLLNKKALAAKMPKAKDKNNSSNGLKLIIFFTTKF